MMRQSDPRWFIRPVASSMIRSTRRNTRLAAHVADRPVEAEPAVLVVVVERRLDLCQRPHLDQFTRLEVERLLRCLGQCVP